MVNPFETIEKRLNSLETTLSHLCGAISEKQENAPIDETYLTRKETAARLRVSLVTLTEWVNRSRLNAYKIGGRVLFRESEVESALSRIVPLKTRRR
ncbi:MAG: helix-turn-helix domain-containing protein [Rikenellaceae bacterium]